MALHFNYSKCSEAGKAALEANDGALIERVAFALMGFNLGEITAKNVREYMFRERCFNAVYGDEHRKPLTEAEVTALVGFYVNVRTMTRKQFMADMAKRLEQRVADNLRYEIAQAQRNAAQRDAALAGT